MGTATKTANHYETIKETAILRSGILVDSIAVFLVSSGINLVLTTLQFFYVPLGTWQILGLTALGVFAYRVLRVRWWFAPLLAVIALGAIGVYYSHVGSLVERLSHWAEFGAWFFSGVPEHEIFSQSAEHINLTYFIICLVTLAVFFLIRRLYSVWFCIAPFIAVIILSGGFYGHHLPISIFTAGIIILLPRAFYRAAEKSVRKGGERFRPPAQLIAVPIAALAVLLSLVVFSPSGSFFQFRPLANVISDIDLLLNPVPIDTVVSFDINAMGFGAPGNRLGGPATLSDGYMLTVVTNTPLLLGGTVMDYYTGYSWLPGREDRPRRFNSVFWRVTRNNTFDSRMPDGGDSVRDAFDAITKDVRLIITYATEFFTTVFTSAGIRNVSFESPELDDNLLFNERAELFLPSPVPINETIIINARVINRDAPLFYETILSFESLVDEDPRFPEIVERYTVLPENLPDIVRETALYVIGDETSPFLKATALSNWIGDNFSYTLSPVVPPDDMDFVAHFFETGEGHCVYFATALAVMARTVGLPSRYVTGFSLIRDPALDNIFYATGRTAHAWAEIYFSGLGWTPFDPLNWNPDIPLNAPSVLAEEFIIYEWWDMDFYLFGVPFYNEWLFAELAGVVHPFIFAAMLVLILVALILVFLLLRKRRNYSVKRVLKKFPDLPGRFSFYYSDIMEQLRKMGAEVNPGETLTEYNKRIKPQLEEQDMMDSSFGIITDAQMRLHFANIPPDVTEVNTAEVLYIKLRGL
ncbi:MAG: transglutaminase-like domain-containing protein [Oscillospiraceae bacterium]|nr:transglutaminase-like domain-containing protein [Oscillospiraceae bacterium]MCL2277817.1 transglutaminase-like domain-containing protein [Oscillospiraceae bacterium]